MSKPISPNVSLIFTPLLIHLAINKQKNKTTRISEGINEKSLEDPTNGDNNPEIAIECIIVDLSIIPYTKLTKNASQTKPG